MGRTVTSVSLIGGDAGTSSRARLTLTGDGVPESVFVKMAGRNGGHPPDGRTGQSCGHRDALLQAAGAGTDWRAEVIRIGLRPADRPFRARTRGPRGRRVRVPRHPASAGQGPGRLDRRASRPASRNVLGQRARMGVHRVGRQRLTADRASAQDLCSPSRRTHRHPRREGPLHRRELPRRGATHRRATAHRHARRRAPRKRLFPQRRRRPARLAGRAAWPPES